MRETEKQQGMQPRGLQLRAISIYETSTILFFFIYQNACNSFFLKNQSLTTLFSEFDISIA
jgi:hypothetical protein